MRKTKRTNPTKWHVYRIGDNYQVLSDDDLRKKDERQRAAYRPVQLGFDTDPEAMAYMMSLAGKGRRVDRHGTN